MNDYILEIRHTNNNKKQNKKKETNNWPAYKSGKKTINILRQARENIFKLWWGSVSGNKG